jgi:hypothetical protein
LEILESIEGPIALQRCLEIDVGCEHSRGCALCGLLAEAQERMKEVFSGTSLATLAGRHLPNGLVQQARQGRNTRIPLTASEASSGFVTDKSEPEDSEASSTATISAISQSLN